MQDIIEQEKIADVQDETDLRQLMINKVGIKDIIHPVIIASDTNHATSAKFGMYVSLPHDKKGTHMSRFIQILNEADVNINQTALNELVTKVCQRLNADNAYIKVELDYFLTKLAPISKVPGIVDYKVIINVKKELDKITTNLTVKVPVTSLCPCSKEISEYGAHNQRSTVTVSADIISDIWLDSLIKLAEKNASAEVYSILKRVDEKYVTEKAYDNPKFVEDIVRDIAGALIKDNRVGSFKVASENFESIHNHSAYAEINWVK